MTRRKVRYLFLGVANVGLGVWALADANYAFGAFLLALSAFWLLTGVGVLPRSERSPEADT